MQLKQKLDNRLNLLKLLHKHHQQQLKLKSHFPQLHLHNLQLRQPVLLEELHLQLKRIIPHQQHLVQRILYSGFHLTKNLLCKLQIRWFQKLQSWKQQDHIQWQQLSCQEQLLRQPLRQQYHHSIRHRMYLPIQCCKHMDNSSMRTFRFLKQSMLRQNQHKLQLIQRLKLLLQRKSKDHPEQYHQRLLHQQKPILLSQSLVQQQKQMLQKSQCMKQQRHQLLPK